MKADVDTLYTSNYLIPGHVYTREELKKQFHITDATINTGVFRPINTNSIWLFVTERKSSDRTPYQDLLKDDTLQWQGQMQGRTDRMIISHRQNNLEILVFYRKRKYEHSGAGFYYEGNFDYKSHSGNHPTSFVFTKQSVNSTSFMSIQRRIENTDDFNPSSIEDGYSKIIASIVRRRGQTTFRAKLIKAYSGCCAVTDCKSQEVLEAAHIIPYKGRYTNHIQNGLLLRADIHVLFDLHLLVVNPNDFRVEIAPQLIGSEYERIVGKKLKLPYIVSEQPSREALKIHFEQKFVSR